MKICHILVLHHTVTDMIIKLIIIPITGRIIIRRICKNIRLRQTAVAFFNPCMRQAFPFIKYSNKKGNNTYTQANYDTKRKCVHKTLHSE